MGMKPTKKVQKSLSKFGFLILKCNMKSYNYIKEC